MDAETETLINELRFIMERMTDKQREEFVYRLTDGYCPRCMSKDLHCCNDE